MNVIDVIVLANVFGSTESADYRAVHKYFAFYDLRKIISLNRVKSSGRRWRCMCRGGRESVQVDGLGAIYDL